MIFTKRRSNPKSALCWFISLHMLGSWSPFKQHNNNNHNNNVYFYSPEKVAGVSAFRQRRTTTHCYGAITIKSISRWENIATSVITATSKCKPLETRSFLSPTNYDEQQEEPSSPTGITFALDPFSEAAIKIVREKLMLSSEQYQQLAKLAVLVNDWNSRINLISRKNCSVEVIFGRHILPSLSPLLAIQEDCGDEDENIIERLPLSSGQRVCDVGTGGGFPGLPLSIARPDVDFLLIDSVGKKITAVQDMADKLGLTNVKTFHGRAESVGEKFDWVVGRSVSAIPTFAFWVYHLLRKNDGRLVYLIGGHVDENISDQAIVAEEIENLFDVPGISDKRILVFPQQAVDKLAKSSGEKLRVPVRGAGGDSTSAGSGTENRNKQTKTKRGKGKARGQWKKRDTSNKKQRGYDDFKRFDSLRE